LINQRAVSSSQRRLINATCEQRCDAIRSYDRVGEIGEGHEMAIPIR
jgi:hypothetical protein